MQPVLDSCYGLDVHKSMIKVCIAKGPLDRPPKFEIRTFFAMTSDLLKLKDWLAKNEVEAVAMESTGVNPQYLKKVRGKKSDVKDCRGLPPCCATV